MQQLAPLVRERIERLDGFIPATAYFFGDDFKLDAEALIPKKLDKLNTYRLVKELVQTVDDLRTWSCDAIQNALSAVAESDKWGKREVFMTVRIAVTGRKATPSLFEMLEVLGKPLCQARLRSALAILKP